MSDLNDDLLFSKPPAAPTTFNVLLYSGHGRGKSTAAATAPGPILWVNCQGPNALAFARKTATERGTVINEVRLDRATTPDIKGVLGNVMKRIATGEDRTVVFDTIGNLRDLLSKQIVVGPQAKSRDQWGEVAKLLRDMILWLRDRDINVVLLAHEDIQDSDDDRIIGPKIGGVLNTDVPNEMDVMAYCAVIPSEEGGTRYVGQLVEAKGRQAKDRSGGLGQIRDLDMSEWLLAFQAALTWEKAKPDDSDVPFGLDDPEPEVDAADPVDAGILEDAA